MKEVASQGMRDIAWNLWQLYDEVCATMPPHLAMSLELLSAPSKTLHTFSCLTPPVTCALSLLLTTPSREQVNRREVSIDEMHQRECEICGADFSRVSDIFKRMSVSQ
eukprot:1586575-Prymnesium_polylepis.1